VSPALKSTPRPYLKLASGKPVPIIRQLRIHGLGISSRKPPFRNEPPLPFEKWIMPPQEERYLKGRKHDFF
jgi:hypothetical protein